MRTVARLLVVVVVLLVVYFATFRLFAPNAHEARVGVVIVAAAALLFVIAAAAYSLGRQGRR